MAAAATKCMSFFSLRASAHPADPTVRTTATGGSSSSGCRKLDGVAMWLVNGVASAFFASLERCSCIRIATYDEDDGDEANDDLPLIYNDGNYRLNGGAASRRRTGKGKKGHQTTSTTNNNNINYDD